MIITSTLRSLSSLRYGVPLKTCTYHGYVWRLNQWNLSQPKRSLVTTSVLKQKMKTTADEKTGDIDVQRKKPYEHLTFGQKVVEAGTDLTYIAVIIAGVGITGFLFYTIGSELFSSSGPNAVYSAAFKKCQNSLEVLDTLGSPINAHGDGRRRKQHVKHMEFVTRDGEKHTRIEFNLRGQFRTATVHAETFINDQGKREFEYVVVNCDGYPPKSIELERRVKPAKPEQITFY